MRLVGAKMSADKRNKRQLYHLLYETLSRQVDSRDELGSLTGYAIIVGLKDFHTSIGMNSKYKNLSPASLQQFRFDEMRTIYTSLEMCIDTLQLGKVDYLLLNIMEKSDECIKTLIKNPESLDSHISFLFKDIVKKLSETKDYQDRLRVSGLLLYDEVQRKKSFSRPYDSLTEDHISVTTSFVQRTI